jgi:hypothetical protein
LYNVQFTIHNIKGIRYTTQDKSVITNITSQACPPYPLKGGEGGSHITNYKSQLIFFSYSSGEGWRGGEINEKMKNFNQEVKSGITNNE